MSAMDAYFIDADLRRITPWTYQYGDMGPKVGGSITIGHVWLNGDVCYVSDDSLLKPARRAFRIKAQSDGQPMMSNGITTGKDNADPEAEIGTLPPMFSLVDLEREIEWLTVDEALRWFRLRASEPAVTRTISGRKTEVIATWQAILDNLEDRAGGYHPDQAL